MVALGCFAPLIFIGLLFFGISSATVTQVQQDVVAVTPIVVTVVAPPTPVSYEPLEKPSRTVAKRITEAEIKR